MGPPGTTDFIETARLGRRFARIRPTAGGGFAQAFPRTQLSHGSDTWTVERLILRGPSWAEGLHGRGKRRLSQGCDNQRARFTMLEHGRHGRPARSRRRLTDRNTGLIASGFGSPSSDGAWCGGSSKDPCPGHRRGSGRGKWRQGTRLSVCAGWQLLNCRALVCPDPGLPPSFSGRNRRQIIFLAIQRSVSKRYPFVDQHRRPRLLDHSKKAGGLTLAGISGRTGKPAKLPLDSLLPVW